MAELALEDLVGDGLMGTLRKLHQKHQARGDRTFLVRQAACFKAELDACKCGGACAGCKALAEVHTKLTAYLVALEARADSAWVGDVYMHAQESWRARQRHEARRREDIAQRAQQREDRR